MFAQLPKILSVFDGLRKAIEHKAIVRRALITMLLSASKFNTIDYKREMIEIAKGLLPDGNDLHLSTWAVARESTLLRTLGDKNRSYGVLQDHIHTLSLSSHERESSLSPRTNGQRGQLVLSYASNLLFDGKTSKAAKELEGWQPLDLEKPSSMELDVARQKHVMLGRALRDEARFQEAIVHVEALLKDAYADSRSVKSNWQSQLFAQLSDLYCEVGRPSRAVKLLQPELELISKHGWEKTPRGKHVRSCYLEALIRQGYLELAQQGLSELDAAFKEVVDPDMLTRTKHFRRDGIIRIVNSQSGTIRFRNYDPD
ncbi:MAG: hypothetical protein M1821_005694 [Bathelium mastoideum]|nr:MAG: hypothetical protein M1821_005694 [Bathelium mastoideum]